MSTPARSSAKDSSPSENAKCPPTVGLHRWAASSLYMVSEHGRTVSARSAHGSCDLCQNMLRLLQNSGAEEANSKQILGSGKIPTPKLLETYYSVCLTEHTLDAVRRSAVFHQSDPSAFDGDGFDLYPCILWKCCYLKGCAGRIRLCKKFAVHFVHGTELVDVCQ